MNKLHSSEIVKPEPPSVDIPASPFESDFWETHLPSAQVIEKLSKVATVLGVAVTGALLFRKQVTTLIENMIKF